MMRPASRGDIWWGIGSWVVAVGYVASMILRGWVPLDEGTLALSARYVANGFLPHRDFAYPYTGGLPWLNAAVFDVAGPSLAGPRWALLAVFGAWLYAIWRLCRRFVGAALAAAVLVLAAWWSVLIYPGATPGYYALFATTWATLALFRWAETGADRWLWTAGGLCGLAMLAKQTGAYALVGCGLGVLAIATIAPPGAPSPHRPSGAEPRAPVVRERWTLASVLVSLAVVMLAPLALIWRRGIASGETLLVAAPLGAVLVLLAILTVRSARTNHGLRHGAPRLAMRAWSILAGAAAIALAPLALWYAAHHALGALVRGAILGGAATAATIGMAMPAAPVVVGLALPVLLVAWLCGLPSVRAVRWFAAAMAVAPYRAVWMAALLTMPAGVCAVVVAVQRAFVQRASAGDRRPALLLVLAAAVAMRALDQFPYAAPNYFAYVAPLAFVLLAASVTTLLEHPATDGPGDGPVAPDPARRPRGSMRLRAIVASPFLVVLALLFGGWFHRIGNVGSVGWQPVWTDDRHRLPGPYGGLEVPVRDSATYARLLVLVGEHGGPEAFIAGPELPALYVLAGTSRLVAQPYLLVPDRYADATTMAATVDTSRVRAVAVNLEPMFLPRLAPGARDWLAHHYPMAERVGDVEFRWR
ncbi:MAG: glycosyltransferase family 39 protein [Gemmatimonadota bacterium]|nr:glycosyltransferase family 39 protein [Gemmatimonadota bacterium]